jgi:hypothetical protein
MGRTHKVVQAQRTLPTAAQREIIVNRHLFFKIEFSDPIDAGKIIDEELI